MVDGAKFNIHDSRSHFMKSTSKIGHWKKNQYIFVNK